MTADNCAEITKEIIVAMLNKTNMPDIFVRDEKDPTRLFIPKWIGESYQTIYRAVKLAETQ
jgi:hypothetical protein